MSIPVSSLAGIPIVTNDLLPPGTYYLISRMDPGFYGGGGRYRIVLTAKYNHYGEPFYPMPTPLWTRHCLGVREGARAKRQQWRRGKRH